MEGSDQAKVAVEKAYKKMMGDPSIFPGATTFVAYWFHLRYMPPEAMPEELESLADLATQMDYIDLSEVEYKSELGYGLHRIRKGHPAIYHAFREEWDELLAECMQGLSHGRALNKHPHGATPAITKGVTDEKSFKDLGISEPILKPW